MAKAADIYDSLSHLALSSEILPQANALFGQGIGIVPCLLLVAVTIHDIPLKLSSFRQTAVAAGDCPNPLRIKPILRRSRPEHGTLRPSFVISLTVPYTNPPGIIRKRLQRFPFILYQLTFPSGYHTGIPHDITLRINNF